MDAAGATGTYVLRSGLSLAPYAGQAVILRFRATYSGQTIGLRFRATTDAANPTAFRIDDVSVK